MLLNRSLIDGGVLMTNDEFKRYIPIRSFVFDEIELDGEKAIRIFDNTGALLTEKEFYDMVIKAKRFYDYREDTEDLIDKRNRYVLFNQVRGMVHGFKHLKVGEKLEIPELVYEFKEFNPNLQRKWSCKCGLCGTKISSDKEDGYYLLTFQRYIHDMNIDVGKTWFGYRRACSLGCADVLWRDVIKQWITENDYKEFFIMD